MEGSSRHTLSSWVSGQLQHVLMEIPGVVVAFSRNGWMNEALNMDWVTRVWGTLNFQWRFLVWDACRCHLVSSVSSHVKRSTNSDISVIPGRLTSPIHPADVSWNKPFKEAYKALYNEWMASGERFYIAAGDMHAADTILCLQWVKGSLEVCFTRSYQEVLSCLWNISQHWWIARLGVSCLKEGRIAAEASTTITEKTRELNSDRQLDIQDVFVHLIRRTSLWTCHSDTVTQ